MPTSMLFGLRHRGCHVSDRGRQINEAPEGLVGGDSLSRSPMPPASGCPRPAWSSGKTGRLLRSRHRRFPPLLRTWDHRASSWPRLTLKTDALGPRPKCWISPAEGCRTRHRRSLSPKRRGLVPDLRVVEGMGRRQTPPAKAFALSPDAEETTWSDPNVVASKNGGRTWNVENQVLVGDAVGQAYLGVVHKPS